MNLRSATLKAPRPARQALRRIATRLTPTRLLLAHGPAASNAVSLTFDDGPDPVGTPAVLTALAGADARATFFIQGSQAASYPEMLAAIKKGGHDIGHHSWSHNVPSQTSAAQLTSETIRTRALVSSITAVDSYLFRPPHGALTIGKAIGQWRLGQTIVLWSADPGDVFQSSAASLIGWFDRNPLRPGDVVLFHEKSEATQKALPQILSRIRAQGLGFATIGDWRAGATRSRAAKDRR
jgi:peptidoglycan/xylan/chitin deacetylase (PgdA/CDA1 family)